MCGLYSMYMRQQIMYVRSLFDVCAPANYVCAVSVRCMRAIKLCMCGLCSHAFVRLCMCGMYVRRAWHYHRERYHRERYHRECSVYIYIYREISFVVPRTSARTASTRLWALCLSLGGCPRTVLLLLLLLLLLLIINTTTTTTK